MTVAIVPESGSVSKRSGLCVSWLEKKETTSDLLTHYYQRRPTGKGVTVTREVNGINSDPTITNERSVTHLRRP